MGVVRDRAVHEEVIRMVMDYASSIEFLSAGTGFFSGEGTRGKY